MIGDILAALFIWYVVLPLAAAAVLWPIVWVFELISPTPRREVR